MKRFGQVLAIFLFVVLLSTPLLFRDAAATEARDGYVSLDEAGVILRDYWEAHNEGELTIKFYLKDPRNLTSMQVDHILHAAATKHTGVGTQGDYLNWCLDQWSSDFTEEFDGSVHYITYHITRSMYYVTPAQEQELNAKVQQILQELNLTGKSDFEKVQAIYQYVCDHADYNDEAALQGASGEYRTAYSAYGVLVEGSGVCQGYCTAIYRLMLQAGIDCRVISGDMHGWNIVKLDGLYYNLDATWDGQNAETTSNYFLLGNSHFWVSGHTPDPAPFGSQAFMTQYPVSAIDYGDATTFTASGKCGENATWELTEDGTLLISGSGDMWDYGYGDYTPAYDQHLRNYIKKVVVSSGITSITDCAFTGFRELTSVELPDTVTRIGNCAFQMCTKLEKIVIPNSVTQLGEQIFDRCYSLKEVTLSNSVKELGHRAFYGCVALQTITLPNELTMIGPQAFGACTGLRNISIPNSVKEIGQDAFVGSFDPSAKAKVTIPASVTKVGNGLFCWANVAEVTWNAKTSQIGNMTFYMCEYLEKVTISDSVTTFGDEVFAYSNNLKSVKLPANLSTVGTGTFVKCTALKSIELPDTLTVISNSMFMRSGLAEVKLPAGLARIEDWAFYECTALKHITIPSGLDFLGNLAFGDCVYLESIKFEGDAPQINPGVCIFSFCKATIYYPKNNPTWTKEAMAPLGDGGIMTFVATHGPNDPHTPGAWKYDNDTHWRTCTDCGEIFDNQPHTWDAGHVSKAPSCKEEGVQTFSCTDCGATKTAALDKLTEHTYSAVCDAACNICGHQRSVTHDYSADYTADSKTHWYACTVCKEKTEEQKHVPGAEATEETPQICTVCGWVIQAALGHTHTPDTAWAQDPTGHWHICSGCGETLSFAEHTWENACDTDCGICGYTRSTEHNFTDTWFWDEMNHWRSCSVCGENAGPEAHRWEEHLCVICGLDTTPNVTPSAPSEPAPSAPENTTPTVPTSPTEPDNQDDEKTTPPIWIPILIVGVLIAGIALVLALRKRKKA